MASKRLGKLVVKNSAYFLCDMQEKFRPMIQYYPQVIEVAKRVLTAANILKMPVIVTEQYPTGLGPTVSELDVANHPVFPKTDFSMALPEVEKHLKENHPYVNSVVLCGIESHVCVLQTVLDLRARDMDVHVVVDGCSSRSMIDRKYAFERMKEAGAFLTTSESVILGLAGGSAHPNFRELQKIIWDSAPDSGLASFSSDK